MTKTTQPTFNEALDKHIEKFYKKVFIHAYKLGQEFPEDKDPKKIFDPCNADDRIELESAIISLIKERVIGEDEPLGSDDTLEAGRILNIPIKSQNKLRAEMRAILEGRE